MGVGYVEQSISLSMDMHQHDERPSANPPHNVKEMHRFPTRYAQGSTSMYHFHAVYRLAHIQTTGLLQRSQVPPAYESVFSRTDSDYAALTFVPDQ